MMLASRSGKVAVTRHTYLRSRLARDTRSTRRTQMLCVSQQQDIGTESDSWSLQGTGSRLSWQRKDLHVVLVHPQIPQNAGNVARTCAATAVPLHLVEPLGFDIDSRKLKRAGLDYWPYVVVEVHKSWEAFHDYFRLQEGPKRLIAFSKFGNSYYASPGLYRKGDWLLFGAETTGLPPEAHQAAKDSGGDVVKIPIVEDHVRSLNLAVSAGVGLYEAVRQVDQFSSSDV